MTHPGLRPIKIFTPSDAGAGNTNAQNLTVKEVVARLPEDRFHVTMLLCDGQPDPRLAERANTRLVKWRKHGNTVRLLPHCLFPPPDVYFFPRRGPLDRFFFHARHRMSLRTALVTYIVMEMNATTGAGLIGRSVEEGDIVVGNSKYVSETIHRAFGVHAAVIHDGIDRRYFSAPDRRTSKASPVVLYAGSFQPRKRVELIIEQAARLPHVQFRLAGKGETELHCRELAAQQGCNNISFLGHLSPEQLGGEMRHADIFFFPSIQEGNPQVLLQAAASGLPSIAMELYRSDYVIDGKTAFLARSDSDLSRSLDRLINDEALRQSFAAAAVSHAANFDWVGITQQWAAIFEEAAAKRRAVLQQKAS
ncbi:MAG TPA: glycosyltransferase family 4 protein [Candidatus Sulfotelmatobacter sp.]|jgi:glycosyltransferase involved in cell wall biosynthesis